MVFLRIMVILLVVFSLSSLSIAKGKGVDRIKLDSKINSMKKAGVGPVIFPHKIHERAYKCNDCHPKIFKKKRRANNISMKKNMNGQYCGSASCHDGTNKKTFPLFKCANCHTKVKKVRR